MKDCHCLKLLNHLQNLNYFAIPLLKSSKGLFIVEMHSAYPASSQALH